MTIWERLGISRTTDIKAIKRAYAKQLKVYHPEDDPQGYQALREAFDAALSFAKRESSREEMIEDEELHGDIGPQTLLVPGINHLQLIHEQIQPDDNEQLLPPPRIPVEIIEESGDAGQVDYHTVPDFIAAFLVLYEHFPSRISREKWLMLLNSSVMWDITAQRRIVRNLLFIFMDRKLYLPTEIWQLLESSLDLANTIRESRDFEDERNPNSIWNYYLIQLKEPGLRYDYLLKAEDLDYDQYLQLRDQGNIALSLNDLKEAESCLKRAYALFADDPDLLRLLGNCYIRLKQYIDALSSYNQLIQMQPEELSNYLYKALALFNIGRIDQALELCKFILYRRPDHHGAMILLGYCYKELGGHEEGLKCFKNVLQATDEENRDDFKIRKSAVNGVFYINTNYLTSQLNPEDIEYELPPNPTIYQQFNVRLGESAAGEQTVSCLLESNSNTVSEFVDAIMSLYQHFPSRISQDKWLELFNSSIMGNIDSVLQIRYRLMMILKERKLYLPTEIWQLLESAFDLENTIRQSREFINNRSLNYIWNYYLRQLKQPSLRYEFLLQAEGLDYEQFLQLRDQGYTALCQNNLRRAEFDLKQAYALFADDPELLRLLGECCMRAGQYEMALAYFDQLIRVLPEEIDGHLYKARIWYGMGQFIQAAEQCLSILSQWPGNYDAVILLSHCRKNPGEHKETEDLLNKAVMLSCQNPDILVEQPYYMEVNQTHRRNWKRLLSKKILIHMITLLATSALIVSCISYFMYMNSQNTTFTVTSLKDLELISEQQYAELTISNLKDTKVNQYPDEHGSTDSIIYENSAYAFLNYNQYGDPTYRIYLGELEFDGQHIIVAADPTVDMLNIPNGTSIKGYVHTVNSRLESVVTHMLKWKPSNPKGTPEAKLELYNKSIAIGYSPDSESKSIPVPDIYQKYIEVTAPRWNSPVNTQNIALLVLILAIWTHSLYHLIFEYRKKRGLL